MTHFTASHGSIIHTIKSDYDDNSLTNENGVPTDSPDSIKLDIFISSDNELPAEKIRRTLLPEFLGKLHDAIESHHIAESITAVQSLLNSEYSDRGKLPELFEFYESQISHTDRSIGIERQTQFAVLELIRGAIREKLTDLTSRFEFFVSTHDDIPKTHIREQKL